MLNLLPWTKKKDFPRRCRSCLQRAVKPDTIFYTAHAERNGKSYDVHILDLECPICYNCGDLHLDQKAEERIDKELSMAMGKAESCAWAIGS